MVVLWIGNGVCVLLVGTVRPTLAWLCLTILVVAESHPGLADKDTAPGVGGGLGLGLVERRRWMRTLAFRWKLVQAPELVFESCGNGGPKSASKRSMVIWHVHEGPNWSADFCRAVR